MKSIDLAQKLDMVSLIDTEKEISIEGVYIGDLLSIVMSKAKQNYVWVTIQTHINIMAVAELLDLSCIIIAENMELEKDALAKAQELDILVFKTHLSAYQVACKLYDMGIRG